MGKPAKKPKKAVRKIVIPCKLCHGRANMSVPYLKLDAFGNTLAMERSPDEFFSSQNDFDPYWNNVKTWILTPCPLCDNGLRDEIRELLQGMAQDRPKSVPDKRTMPAMKPKAHVVRKEDTLICDGERWLQVPNPFYELYVEKKAPAIFRDSVGP